jgi:hypothetical protein
MLLRFRGRRRQHSDLVAILMLAAGIRLRQEPQMWANQDQARGIILLRQPSQLYAQRPIAPFGKFDRLDAQKTSRP